MVVGDEDVENLPHSKENSPDAEMQTFDDDLDDLYADYPYAEPVGGEGTSGGGEDVPEVNALEETEVSIRTLFLVRKLSHL